MGFDRVDYKCKCPNCGEEVGGFQSKDNDCNFELLQVQEVSNFYSECYYCRTWIEFDRISWGLFEMKYGPLLDIDKHSKLVYIRKC